MEVAQKVEKVEESGAPKGVPQEPILFRREPRKFPTWTDLFATAGVFLFSVLFGGVVMALITDSGMREAYPFSTFVYYLVQMIPPILFVVWLRRRAGLNSGIHLGVRRVNLPIVLWGVLVVLVSGIVLEPLLDLFPQEGYDTVVQTIGRGGWAILSTVVAAPILEEMFFRGLVMESCKERFGSAAALLLSSLLFGVIHIVPVQMVNAFVVGLILGYAYLRTRSLLSVMIIHAVNNGIAYATISLFGNNSNLTLRELIPLEWLYYLVYGLAVVFLVWAMWRMFRVLRDNTELG